MRPFRLAPALISALLLQSTFTTIVRAQPAPPAEDPAEGAEEAPMEDAEEAPPAPPSAPAAPTAPPAEEEVPADEEIPSDAEMEAEMSKELAAEDAAGAAALTRPPAKGKGAIVGVVKDAVEHETAPEAQISVVGTKIKTIADFDGRYRLELPPGTYTLRIYVELYKPSVLKGVEVKAGAVERFDIDVVPDETSTDTVEIVTEVDKSSVEGLLLTRQRSASVGDGVGRAEIARTPASNAAQATQRVVGATIVGNRFVYVRGLGERYTNALLNGTPLPSPEPDRAAIPLDLFPSLILESVNIVKTFTPDLPGDFAGGSVHIETRELPTKPLFQISLGAGVDSKSTFRERLSHPGSSTDFLGYDGGTRSLPDSIPPYVLKKGDERPGGDPDSPADDINDEDLLAAGRDINSSMHPRRSFSLPNYSLSAVGGNGWRIGEDQRLGVLASFNYGRAYKIRKTDVNAFVPDLEMGPDGEERSTVRADKQLEIEQGEDRVNWGALASASYWFSQSHRVTLTGLHTQLADATTQLTRGLYSDLGGEVANGQLRYVSRALNFLQLRGEHQFKGLNRAELKWNGSYSVASRDEPDTRNTVYQFNAPQNSWNAINIKENGSHLFAGQHENAFGVGVDWTQPLTSDPEVAKVKLGGLASRKKRDFAARRFSFLRPRGAPIDNFQCGPVYELNCPERIYQWANIGETIDLEENTQETDAYEAELNVTSGYFMFDVRPLQPLRVIAGARLEHTGQSIAPYSQFSTGTDPKGASIDSDDWLPALAITYSATKKTNLRVGLSRTLARPQIRELSPFSFGDYFGARPISGNPQLRLTYIQNADLRFEMFPTPREVLAFSFFYKLFDDPIEPFVFPSGEGTITYQNAQGARLVGMEVEGRKSLDFVSKSLKDFSVIGNLTLAGSEIELDTNQLSSVTNLERPMVNQAPYVINLSIDYASADNGFSARLLGNILGPRIVEVGTNGLDDAYAQPTPTLDATVSKELGKHFNVKLNATNLLNRPIIVTLGKESREDREMSRYKDGRIFTLSATYTH
jgi:outer membrane receptor protein involved in Fe transport